MKTTTKKLDALKSLIAFRADASKLPELSFSTCARAIEEARAIRNDNYDRRSKAFKQHEKTLADITGLMRARVSKQFRDYAVSLGFAIHDVDDKIQIEDEWFRFEARISNLDYVTYGSELSDLINIFNQAGIYINEARTMLTSSEIINGVYAYVEAKATERSYKESQRINRKEVEKLMIAAGLQQRYQENDYYGYGDEREMEVRKYELRSDDWKGPRYTLEHIVEGQGSALEMQVRIKNLKPETAVEVHKLMQAVLDQLIEKFGGDSIEMKRDLVPVR